MPPPPPLPPPGSLRRRHLALQDVDDLLEVHVLRVRRLSEDGRARAHLLDDGVQDTADGRLDERVLRLQLLQRLVQPRQLERCFLGEVVRELLHQRGEDDLRRRGRRLEQLRRLKPITYWE